MTIHTVYTCDKCKIESRSDDQFWTVGIQAFSQRYPSRDREFVPKMQMNVCRPCLEQLGINVQKETIVKSPPPTLEDLIRDIVQTHLDNQ